MCGLCSEVVPLTVLVSRLLYARFKLSFIDACKSLVTHIDITACYQEDGIANELLSVVMSALE